MHLLMIMIFLFNCATNDEKWAQAIENGDLAKVKRIIEEGYDVNKLLPPDNNKPALFIAVYKDNSNLVAILLKAGADPNIINAAGGTPLSYAKSHKVMDLLLEAGADVNARREGSTPLVYNFLSLKKLGLLKKLVNHGADLTARPTQIDIEIKDWTPLMAAIEDNEPEVGLYLIKQGVPVNATDKFGTSALLLAIGKESGKYIRLLLAHGARTDIESDGISVSDPKVTPKSFAIERANSEDASVNAKRIAEMIKNHDKK